MAISAVPKLVRDLWLPSFSTVVGTALALAVSVHVERERREQLARSASVIAAESRAAIALTLNRHLAAVEDLAALWARFGRAPEKEWAEDAQLLMKNADGIRYLAWVSLGGAPLRVARAPGANEAAPVDESEARSHAGGRAIVGPERRPAGGYAYRLYQPVPLGAAAAGVLAAGVDVDALLENVLRDSAPGYAISIFWGDHEIATRGRASHSADLAWWRNEGSVALGSGVAWRIVHAPTEELAATLVTPLPAYLAVGGSALSLALGVMVYQLGRARRQGRVLAAANRGFDLRIREARESEASLRRLSEELEQRVRSRTRRLEGAMADLEAFNFSVSHDLRAPIGAVLNFAVILEEEHAPSLLPAGRELVARIRRSAERSIALLEGLLKLSRAGRAELEIETLDMTALAREAFAQARGADDDSDLEFVLGSLPPARGDRALVGSVFVNLLANAVKYTRGREKRRIVVSGVSTETTGVYSVSDNGVGFDDRHASKLFGAFERLQPSHRFEGAGIGLATVARIVQRHGGRAWAEGRPEQGATFFFSLEGAERDGP